jgi:hypothetical protein
MCQQRQAPHVATWQGSEAQVKRNQQIAAHIAAVEKELNRVKK